MLVLGIESSCDETAAAVVQNGSTIKSNIIASQIATHSPYGGVVPELASREHLNRIDDVVNSALDGAGVALDDLDGLAATRGPGLVGSLLVGLSYAKSLAWVTNKPLVGVNHIEGHIYSVVFEHGPLTYPALALVVSGGHTSLFLIPEEGRYATIGRTRDDAAGEAFDKIAKLLGLGYPGGPVIDRLAKTGNPASVDLVFTLPRMDSSFLDFSFSGLKTAVLRYVRENGVQPVSGGSEPAEQIRDIAACFQQKVVDSLITRVRQAAARHHPRTIILAGGVACNSALRNAMSAEDFGAPVCYPSPILTTDNAAMIAAAGYRRLGKGESDPLDISAEPSLKLENIALEGYQAPAKARYRL
ncbi:MAG TPA: tRNA (adenosine(37)-N6)-threonylcarbamoyltransferase complex transferase subunit TsaD [Blastocatellia bacterium]|nr:tRNA (adenosine(37)-N6)-threonylcarbamoyltransferase complex transferase subunit TsaD [Blastocatellia bacterium]